MNVLGNWLLQFLAQWLEPRDREAALGDLTEAGEGVWAATLEILGLVVRRQLLLWKTWRPWLAAFGLALPGSLLLMGLSISVSQGYENLIGPALRNATGLPVSPGLLLLVCHILLLAGWSWTGGFVVGAVSRRTVWVSALLSFAPCLFCLARFRIESLSRLCLLLFMPPAIWGLRRGLGIIRIKVASALILALSLTALTLPLWTVHGAWIPNWALSWPAWYLVATAQRSEQGSDHATHH